MYCIKCGKELSNDMDFCPFCGEKIHHNVIDIIEEEKVDDIVEKGPWKNFAKIGHVLGILALCLFWLVGSGIYLGTLGIIFSCLGRKSKINHEMANTAFKRSLIGTILALGFISLLTSLKVTINLLK